MIASVVVTSFGLLLVVVWASPSLVEPVVPVETASVVVTSIGLLLVVV